MAQNSFESAALRGAASAAGLLLEAYAPSFGTNMTFAVALDAMETIAVISEVCLFKLLCACVFMFVCLCVRAYVRVLE